jgi:hypothetical protein
VPAVGLDVPVGVQANDHLDTQVYAYKSSPRMDLPRKDQPAVKPRVIKDKKVRTSFYCVHFV